MTSERHGLTPSATVGPYLSIGLDWGDDGRLLVPEGTDGSFWVRGQVLGGDGEAIEDALIEFWQADPQGHFDHPDDPRGVRATAVEGFRGFGRSHTVDPDRRYKIHTVRPGPLPAGELDDEDGPLEAPHINVTVFARGMLIHTVTRMYFPGEPLNATDPVLATVPEERRDTLVAREDGEGGYAFDIRLQGNRETVFFQT
ncbi:MAG: protocatechuate 3,4-dioxygenase subunit alpha [Actinomycetaceae bacterium]